MGHLTLIVTDPADMAWEKYRKLAAAAIEDQSLWIDREHCEAVFRAYEEFRRAFLKEAS